MNFCDQISVRVEHTDLGLENKEEGRGKTWGLSQLASAQPREGTGSFGAAQGIPGGFGAGFGLAVGGGCVGGDRLLVVAVWMKIRPCLGQL